MNEFPPSATQRGAALVEVGDRERGTSQSVNTDNRSQPSTQGSEQSNADRRTGVSARDDTELKTFDPATSGPAAMDGNWGSSGQGANNACQPSLPHYEQIILPDGTVIPYRSGLNQHTPRVSIDRVIENRANMNNEQLVPAPGRVESSTDLKRLMHVDNTNGNRGLNDSKVMLNNVNTGTTPGYRSVDGLDFGMVAANNHRLKCIFDVVASTEQANYLAARVPLPSALNIAQWKQELRGYTDKKIVNYLEFGWPIGINREAVLHTQFIP